MIFDYVLAWLITYGFAFSFAVTKGPYALFEKFREYVKSDPDQYDWVKVGVECPICLSFWFGFAVMLGLGGGVTMWLSSFGFTCLVVSLSPD